MELTEQNNLLTKEEKEKQLYQDHMEIEQEWYHVTLERGMNWGLKQYHAPFVQHEHDVPPAEHQNLYNDLGHIFVATVGASENLNCKIIQIYSKITRGFYLNLEKFKRFQVTITQALTIQMKIFVSTLILVRTLAKGSQGTSQAQKLPDQDVNLNKRRW